jgi:hypothetical protein
VLPFAVPEFVDVVFLSPFFVLEFSLTSGELPACRVTAPDVAPAELPSPAEDPGDCATAKGHRAAESAGTSKNVSLFFM